MGTLKTNSKSNYEVSVIIPTYNRAKLLKYTLDSLVVQNINKDRFEVIIGDDGSSDNTRELVRNYENQLNVKYVYQEDTGYRPGSARNNAIKVSEGKICLFIDSSVILNTDCIEQHIIFHSNKKSPKAAIGYVYGFDHNEESETLLKKLVIPSDVAVSIHQLSEYPVFSDVREEHYAYYKDNLENLPAPWFYFWTCHLSIDSKDLLNVGLFDENYDGRWGVEDNDLGYRLFHSGVKISLLRAATSIHYPHGKEKEARQQEGYENCVYFHKKFKCLGTKLFLETYTNKHLPDLNSLIITAEREVEKNQETLVRVY